jgi:hypothetical protein
MSRMSRREFVALAATGAATAPFVLSHTSASAAISAQAIVDRIKQNVGVEWKPETVDTFKVGDPDTVVTGIVTTAMATMDVLKKAVAAGANFVITTEPTFYGRADGAVPSPGRGVGPGAAPGAAATPPRPDAVVAAKRDFIAKHSLVVWRFSDHWRLRKPDPLAQGLADVLGWSRLTAADDPRRVSIAAVRLDALAADIKKRLNVRGGVRVIGNPQTRVQTIGLLPGSTALQASLNVLPGVDAIVAGEVREWETVEYARDVVAAGAPKGLILVGRVVSEDPGTKVCAAWIKTIVPELTTTWIAAGDPYWRPL